MKLNYLYCLLAFLFMPLCIKAQDVKYLKYQGEVNTSFSFSIDEETSNLNLEVINGIRFSRYFLRRRHRCDCQFLRRSHPLSDFR